jgi:double-strand break repair protein MRE11
VSFEWRYQIDPEQFADSNSAFNHVNYEDENINVAIPVFSIHGNHDDPSGEGHLAALDILQMSGLLNYYGRTPESDNIQVKPVLLQKGSTKLALYGMSNVRDERLFRTFRDGNVKFFQPNLHKDEWFNLASVHQNHHAYTESGYLPESFLPEFLDLIIWGHEHECKIEPETNTERGFKVIQPGSSVATSLCQPETEAKHVTILSITGKEFTHEPIRLKSVRPFVMREVVLQEDRQMRKIGLEGGDNKAAVDRFCMKHVDELIKQANAEWLELQQENDDELDEELVPPLPLIRLRVEYTAPEGGSYIIDNPQRFSARFAEKVANTNDIIQYHRKKAAGLRKPKEAIALPTENAIAQLGMDAIKIDELVKEFLTAQNLTILPQSAFGDAVQQFVQKDDKHAMEEFISTTMGDQVDHLVNNDGDMEDENAIAEMMEELKNKWEQKFEKGDRTTRSVRTASLNRTDGILTSMVTGRMIRTRSFVLNRTKTRWTLTLTTTMPIALHRLVRLQPEVEETGPEDVGAAPPLLERHARLLLRRKSRLQRLLPKVVARRRPRFLPTKKRKRPTKS